LFGFQRHHDPSADGRPFRASFHPERFSFSTSPKEIEMPSNRNPQKRPDPAKANGTDHRKQARQRAESRQGEELRKNFHRLDKQR
jgi:hypothetical protein